MYKLLSIFYTINIFALGLSLVFILIIFFPNNSYSQTFDKVGIMSLQVTDDIYMLTGKGGNMGLLIGGDGVLLIDDQFAPLTDKIRSTINLLTSDPIRFIINTHWHHDHTGGNENFGKTGSIIIAHDNVRERLASKQFIEFLDRTVGPSPNSALPIITYTDSVTFNINNDTIKVYHTPNAHTDGDSIIYFTKNNVLHTGDIYRKNLYPFIDLSSNGSIDGIIHAVEKMINSINNKTKIIPGHGDLSSFNDLQEYLIMLKSVRNTIYSSIEAGNSLDQVLKSKPTAQYDMIYGNDTFIKPDDFVKAIFKSLNQDA